MLAQYANMETNAQEKFKALSCWGIWRQRYACVEDEELHLTYAQRHPQPRPSTLATDQRHECKVNRSRSHADRQAFRVQSAVPRTRTDPHHSLEIRNSSFRISLPEVVDTTTAAQQPVPPSTMSSTTKASGKKPAKAGRSAIADVVAREYTIHLHKRVRSV